MTINRQQGDRGSDCAVILCIFLINIYAHTHTHTAHIQTNAILLYCMRSALTNYIIGVWRFHMDATAELGRNPVSKHQIQPEYGDEQADAGRDG